MLRRRLYTVSSVWCDQGDLRPSNQDHVLARQGMLDGRAAGLYLVADGCGGLAYGGEISRLVAESCDFTVSIPMFGKINSLNASAAAAVLLYEAVRQRMG